MSLPITSLINHDSDLEEESSISVQAPPSDAEPDRPLKKKRGRPRTNNENVSEHRREQIRNAQKAYRERKETAITKLQERVTDLETVVEAKTRAVQEFHEHAAASIGSIQQPRVADELSRLMARLLDFNRQLDQGSLGREAPCHRETAMAEVQAREERDALLPFRRSCLGEKALQERGSLSSAAGGLKTSIQLTFRDPEDSILSSQKGISQHALRSRTDPALLDRTENDYFDRDAEDHDAAGSSPSFDSQILRILRLCFSRDLDPALLEKLTGLLQQTPSPESGPKRNLVGDRQLRSSTAMKHG